MSALGGQIPKDQYMTQAVPRERAAQVLRDRARRMHDEAVQLENLADWAVGLNDAQNEALWRIVMGFRI